MTVRALNDGNATDESFNLTHNAVVADTGNPYHNISIDPVAVTTTDATHGVVVSKDSLSVKNNNGTGTYTVVLKSDPGGPVEISAALGSGLVAVARVSVSPPTLTFTSSDWFTPQTVTVTARKGASPSFSSIGGFTTIDHQVITPTTQYPTSTVIPSVSLTVLRIVKVTIRTYPTDGITSGLEGQNIRISGGVRVYNLSEYDYIWCVRAGADGGTATYNQNGPDYGMSTEENTRVALDDNNCAEGGRSSWTNTASRADLKYLWLNTSDDAIDEPDETIGIRYIVTGTDRRPHPVINRDFIGHPNGSADFEYTIQDNDPTIVSLARVGSGTVEEGEVVEFTVTLGRELVAGGGD